MNTHQSSSPIWTLSRSMKRRLGYEFSLDVVVQLMRQTRSLTIAVATAIFVAVALPAWAQVTTGNLDGRVTDDTGGILPGVTVTLVSPTLMGHRMLITDATGTYRATALPPGTYTLTYELSGFQTRVQHGVRVDLGATTTLDVGLNVSTLAEVVTVTRESPVVDVRNTNVATTFSTALLQDLPGSRQGLALLAQTPGVQSARIEVGASDLAQYTAPRVYGVAGRQQFNLDGVDITEGTAHVGTYPDYSSWEEVSISAAAHTAEARYPGVLTNTVIKSGGNVFHGSFYGDYQNASFEGSNSSPELVARGLNRGTKLDGYWESSAELGGHIVRDRLWFYVNGRRQKYTSFPAGYFDLATGDPMATDVTMDGGTLKMTWKVSQNHTFSSFIQRTAKIIPQNRAGAGVPPESTVYWPVYAYPWKAQWTSVLSPRTVLDVGAYVHYQDWNTTPNSFLPRRYDLTTTWQDGQNSTVSGVDFSNYRRQGFRPQFRASLYHQISRHDLKAGFEYLPYIETITYGDSYGQAVHLFRGGTTPVGQPLTTAEQLAGRFGTPSEVILYNTPVTVKDGLLTMGGFIHDTWTVSGRTTLNLGLRLDTMEAFFPEQSSPTRLWAPAESFPEVRDLVNWTSFSPRAGVAHSLTADRRTVLKLNYGLYQERLDTRVFDLVNGNGYRTSRFVWNDLDGDGLLVNADGTVDADEVNLANPLSSTGGSTTTLDPNLKQPKMHEFVVALDRELMPNFAIRVDYNYRRLTDNVALVNRLQTFDEFSIPTTVVDPGVDGVYGTADDGTVAAFNLNPALVGGSFVRDYVTNPDGFDQSYHSITITGDRRMRDNWQFRASVTLSTIDEVIRGGGIGFDARIPYQNWPRNPNEAQNSRTDWMQWNARAMGSYLFPRLQLQLGGVVRMQSGEQFARRFISRSGELNYGTQWFWAEPLNSNRLDNVFVTDLRAEKLFTSGQMRFAILFDVFNLFNSDAVLAANNQSGPSFLRVSSVIAPRVAKVGARVTF